MHSDYSPDIVFTAFNHRLDSFQKFNCELEVRWFKILLLLDFNGRIQNFNSWNNHRLNVSSVLCVCVSVCSLFQSFYSIANRHKFVKGFIKKKIPDLLQPGIRFEKLLSICRKQLKSSVHS